MCVSVTTRSGVGAKCSPSSTAITFFSQSEHVPLIKIYSTTRDRTLPPPVWRLGFRSHRSPTPAAAALSGSRPKDPEAVRDHGLDHTLGGDDVDRENDTKIEFGSLTRYTY